MLPSPTTFPEAAGRTKRQELPQGPTATWEEKNPRTHLLDTFYCLFLLGILKTLLLILFGMPAC